MSPRRIQRKRWQMPDGAVYVGRPSRWGNPFRVVPAAGRRGGRLDMWAVRFGGATLVRFDRKTDAADDATDRFRRRIAEDKTGLTLSDIRTDLAGKDLACWCPLGQPCHADVLLELANPDLPLDDSPPRGGDSP